jgi:hypothetical protein
MCVGVALGLVGAGGSILTMPVLVYLMGVPPKTATGYSLLIVGLTALAGSITYMRVGLVNYRTAVVFALPSFAGVFVARRYLMPAVPEVLAEAWGFSVTRDAGIMLLFALLMLAASLSMIRSRKDEKTNGDAHFNPLLILAEGLVVGVLTGLVGAGGGFLIIPALVVLTGLPMKMAVGTSLLIIAVKSLFGLAGDPEVAQFDWMFLAVFSMFTVGGIVIGSYAARKVSGARLKPAFGWFVLAMGAYIILREALGIAY